MDPKLQTMINTSAFIDSTQSFSSKTQLCVWDFCFAWVPFSYSWQIVYGDTPQEPKLETKCGSWGSWSKQKSWCCQHVPTLKIQETS